MESLKIAENVPVVIKFIDSLDLKPEEKIATLDATSGLLKAVISAEVMQLMYANFFKGGR